MLQSAATTNEYFSYICSVKLKMKDNDTKGR